jgi:pyridoxine 5-phosphate synthase
MTKLSVNVNKIATLRNTRDNGIPDLVRLSEIALGAGAHGITVHPRPDERHIRGTDVAPLAELVRRHPGAEYNIEGNPFHGLVEHCAAVRPNQATLVPDEKAALTSNHGWNLGGLADGERKSLARAMAELRGLGCRVSLFVDPDPAVMPLARDLGADRVELYTEPYATAAQRGDAGASLKPYAAAAQAARAQGLGLNAGHDLSLTNLAAFLAAVPVDEVSIGHALIADALELGLAETVRRYATICAQTGATR